MVLTPNGGVPVGSRRVAGQAPDKKACPTAVKTIMCSLDLEVVKVRLFLLVTERGIGRVPRSNSEKNTYKLACPASAVARYSTVRVHTYYSTDDVFHRMFSSLQRLNTTTELPGNN